MAAGFDKHAEVADGLLGLGFGFVEVGTMTPKPQPGNPAPRLFRLRRRTPLINRSASTVRATTPAMPASPRDGGARHRRRQCRGQQGQRRPHRRLCPRHRRASPTSPTTSPSTSPRRTRRACAACTRRGALARLLVPCRRGARRRAAAGAAARQDRARPRRRRRSPTWSAVAREAGSTGLIVSNTTVSRAEVTGHRHAGEAGGLSGRPLFRRSTAMLAKVRALAGPEMVLVGVGGVDSPETAFAKILAGADLVQIYTGLIFRGPTLPGAILAALPRLLARRGFATLADAVGADPEAYRALA
jgi:dihydroorotate dehydrogenase